MPSHVFFSDAAGIPREDMYDNTNKMKNIWGETTQLEFYRKEEIHGYLECHKKCSDVWAVSNIYDYFTFNNAKYSQALQDHLVLQISEIISGTGSALVLCTKHLQHVNPFGNRSKAFLKR